MLVHRDACISTGKAARDSENGTAENHGPFGRLATPWKPQDSQLRSALRPFSLARTTMHYACLSGTCCIYLSLEDSDSILAYICRDGGSAIIFSLSAKTSGKLLTYGHALPLVLLI